MIHIDLISFILGAMVACGAYIVKGNGRWRDLFDLGGDAHGSQQ